MKIANLGLDHWFHLVNYCPSADVYEELKILNRQYLNYISMRIKAKQTLTNLLDRTMPGIKALLKNRSDAPDRDKLCDFVKEYWHFDNISTLTENEFTKSYNKWTKKKGYRASTSKALKIYALATDGIPTLSSIMPSTKMLVMESVDVPHKIDTTIEHILAQMQELSKTLKEYELVISMPGVGDILCTRIIAEIGDLNVFIVQVP